MSRIAFARFAAAVAALTLLVIVLGAYVRLSDAGLGCPDWPGCYGRLVAPSSAEAVAAANVAHPTRPVHSAKAWKEMVHRYVASALGLAILALAVVAWRQRHEGLPVRAPAALLALVVFQGLLGMWTVTQLVNPAIVTAHLAGALATLALAWWLALRTGGWLLPGAGQRVPRLRRLAIGALVLVCAQTLLGGWTSTHYAALACTEFPTCHGGLWWPPADFAAGFSLWRPLGVDYEFGTLDSPARTAIHLAHRVGALTVLVLVGSLAWHVARAAPTTSQRRLGGLLLLVLGTQATLGIANVLGRLPLPVAVAHTAGAALLLATVLTLIHALTPATRERDA